MANEKRLIDANALIDKHGLDITSWDKPFGVYIQSIENAPTVDAVPVVRCKNCTRCATIGLPRCRMTGRNVTDDDFCSRGERREGE